MINELVRVGIVTQRYPERGSVRVRLVDVDDQVSYELPVIYRKTLKDKDYWMPDINEHVVCLFSGQGLEQGFVLGAIYSEADTVPVSSNNKWHKVFDDGTVIEYDRSAHKLLIDVKGDTQIQITGNASITVNGNTTVKTDGHTDISSGNCISFSCDRHGGGTI
ncbi:phage baseplate assembly protein V [Dissulfurispira sp.]|uniref:phage baseplate assembly protein V n=1 Tax=Dissulfurispira sp. TaxID=2817609 RepID=UPI002FD97485